MEGNFVLLGKQPAFLKRMRFERISLYSLVVISALRYFDLVTRSSGKWNNALSKERWPVRTDKL
ncbi:hypothetical protein P5673_000801 [Acropora cervicornis]|uniref:Uncharacterized protein n=1 Tax=Acropora cervicornis TaxID=6130 RepID=A0AAD9VI58_ACRCE|nr:hypothetical protein P5673_000801 [Acropora cervicornis]